METLRELRCDHCAALLTLFDDTPDSDAEAWERIRAQHADGCTWVAEQDEKRGRRGPQGYGCPRS